MATAAAIVLSGGASRRMGVDKATLVVDGIRLVDRLVGALREAGIARVVLAGPDPGGLDPAVVTAPDFSDEPLGPMAGISTGWGALASLEDASERFDPIIVMSVDLPSIDAATITDLLAASRLHPAGMQCHDGDRRQPLVAGYRRATILALDARFRRGERSVRSALAGVAIGTIPADPERVSDADEPADLSGREVQWEDRS